MELESIVQYLDEMLEIPGFPDYPGVLNGLQVANRGSVQRTAAAVDASEATIREAVAAGCDLLLVHHGLFWGAPRAVIGPSYRKLSLLMRGDVAVYAAHLPLDAHPEVGNAAELARCVGISVTGGFGEFEGVCVGCEGHFIVNREDLLSEIARAVGGEVRLIAGGRQEIRRVAVVTGAGGSLIEHAAVRGIDALITGEVSHQHYAEAMEREVNVYLAGHYRTEIFGVRALARRLEEAFGLPWVFVDNPSGL